MYIYIYYIFMYWVTNLNFDFATLAWQTPNPKHIPASQKLICTSKLNGTTWAIGQQWISLLIYTYIYIYTVYIHDMYVCMYIYIYILHITTGWNINSKIEFNKMTSRKSHLGHLGMRIVTSSLRSDLLLNISCWSK